MHDLAAQATSFIDLDTTKIVYLFIVGFIGGLVSGFIGSGGAFVLTPAMMSLGVPGLVAVASNMCHKFPKALIGSMKRYRYGQVDVKLGVVIGISAEAGVLYGAGLQEKIKAAFGDAGSNLYVSVAFVLVLGIVGGIILKDVLKNLREGTSDEEEKVTPLAKWVQSINIPGTMVYFKSMNARISILFTLPLGFATGMLAATIAVGGFLGVPSMIYVMGVPGLMASATELVIAFVMGLGGSFKYAMHGMVDIRLSMIILAGSLFGIQLGAIGTTYVKPFLIKVVMATIMLIVLFSRALMVPVYMSQLGLISKMSAEMVKVFKATSFAIMILALFIGAFIVLKALFQGFMAERRILAGKAEAVSVGK
ncbi:MAG: sulfite exporter TauE/SafE family protein [Nitrospirae bacterium]|nr:sulfite exporter TauE/SafE family protein [Nitrospirota bacterium]